MGSKDKVRAATEAVLLVKVRLRRLFLVRAVSGDGRRVINPIAGGQGLAGSRPRRYTIFAEFRENEINDRKIKNREG